MAFCGVDEENVESFTFVKGDENIARIPLDNFNEVRKTQALYVEACSFCALLIGFNRDDTAAAAICKYTRRIAHRGAYFKHASRLFQFHDNFEEFFRILQDDGNVPAFGKFPKLLKLRIFINIKVVNVR